MIRKMFERLGLLRTSSEKRHRFKKADEAIRQSKLVLDEHRRRRDRLGLEVPISRRES